MSEIPVCPYDVPIEMCLSDKHVSWFKATCWDSNRQNIGDYQWKKYGFQITRFHFRAKKQTFHTFHRFKFHIFTSSAYPCSTFKPTIVLHRTSSHHPFQRQNIGPGAASAQQPGARGADELGPAGGSHQRAGGGGKVGAGRNTGPGEPSSHWMVFERKMPSFEMDDDWG